MRFPDRLSQVAFVVRFVLAGIFIVASYYKIVSPGSFAHQIYNYKILPPWAINPIAITLPWLQLFCGLALLLNKFEKGAAIWIVLMVATFQMALAAALVRGLNIACGCFKTGGSPATWWTFARDFVLLLTTLFYCWWVLKGRKDAAE
jgi:putative oxidoreductase